MVAQHSITGASDDDDADLRPAIREIDGVTAIMRAINGGVDSVILASAALLFLFPFAALRPDVAVALLGAAETAVVCWAALGGAFFVLIIARTSLKKRGDDLFNSVSDRASHLNTMALGRTGGEHGVPGLAVRDASAALRRYARAAYGGAFLPAMPEPWKLALFMALNAVNSYFFFSALADSVKGLS